MNDYLLLVAIIIDLIVGDPSCYPHPVVIIGRGINILENLLRRIFSSNFEKIVQNEKAVVAGSEYGCDARLIENYAKVPTLMFGPGSIKQAHGINEFIDLNQYIDYIKIIALSIYDLNK
jgi:hypothetical protein